MIGALIGAAIIGATLGLLGSGGSILTVPILVYLAGHTEKSAVIESLVIVGVIALYGAIRRALAGQVVWKAILWFGPGGIVGGVLGATAGERLPGSVQLLVLGVLMLGASVLMLRRGKKGTHGLADDEQGTPRVRNGGVLALTGLGVGFLTGLAGVGGGFMIVPALVLIGGVPMRMAIGTSLSLIFVSCVSSSSKYLTSSELAAEAPVDWWTVLIFSAIGIGGSIVGAHVSNKLDQATLRKAFGVFVAVLGMWIVADHALGITGSETHATQPGERSTTNGGG